MWGQVGALQKFKNGKNHRKPVVSNRFEGNKKRNQKF
jgi:hypothetical protein